MLHRSPPSFCLMGLMADQAANSTWKGAAVQSAVCWINKSWLIHWGGPTRKKCQLIDPYYYYFDNSHSESFFTMINSYWSLKESSIIDHLWEEQCFLFTIKHYYCFLFTIRQTMLTQGAEGGGTGAAEDGLGWKCMAYNICHLHMIHDYCNVMATYINVTYNVLDDYMILYVIIQGGNCGFGFYMVLLSDDV